MTASASSTTHPLEAPAIEPATAMGIRSPLTFRGAILAAFCCYLLAVPVAQQTDIVAAVFGITVLFLIVTMLGLTLVSGARIRRDFAPTLSFPTGDSANGPGEGIIAGTQVGCLLKIPPVSVWPLFVLTIRLEFKEARLVVPLHRITGSFDRMTLLPLPLSFPHRGHWHLRSIEYTFGDQFGLSQLRWRQRVDQTTNTITVRPPRTYGEALPLMTSCQRSGDLVTDLHDRRGDLFDLKPYHPADGMRRIVWKIFARRGELISRQPEASMTPEGQVLVYCVAKEDEDRVCAATLQYLESLEALNIEIFLGCEGMRENAPARSASAGERLMIDSVWEAAVATPPARTDELKRLLGSVRLTMGATSSLERILFFCSAERLEEKTHADFMIALGREVETERVKPVFFLLENFAPSAPRKSAKPSLAHLFVAPTAPTPLTRQDRSSYERFLSTAASAGWEILRFQGGA